MKLKQGTHQTSFAPMRAGKIAELDNQDVHQDLHKPGPVLTT